MAMKMIAIKRCIFQHKQTKEYRWLSLESQEGRGGRYVCESSADSVDQPSQKPLDTVCNPGSLIDYENAVSRVSGEGYDIVTQL